MRHSRHNQVHTPYYSVIAKKRKQAFEMLKQRYIDIGALPYAAAQRAFGEVQKLDYNQLCRIVNTI